MTEAWTAPPAERTEPRHILGERQALDTWLDFHRDTLLHKCAGLTAAQLKERAVPRPACPCCGNGHADLIRERIDGVTGD